MQTMTKIRLAEMVIKLMGLKVLLGAVPSLANLPNTLNFISYRVDESLHSLLLALMLPVSSIMGIAIYLFAGYLLIKKARRIADRFFKEDENIDFLEAFSAENIAKLIIIALGALLTVKYLPGFLEQIVQSAIRVHQVRHIRYAFTSKDWWAFFRLLLPVVIGLFLVIRPAIIYNWLSRIQGKNNVESEAPDEPLDLLDEEEGV